MIRSLALAGVAALALTTAACTSTPMTPAPAPAATTAAKPAATTAAPATTAAAPMTKDIVDTAVAAGSFTTLAKAVTEAGLVPTLKGAGPFTVFAPTDEAFAKLPAGTVEGLLKDKPALTKVLTYHVVPGKVMASDVGGLAGKTVKTVQGTEFTVKVADGKVMLMDAAGNTVNVVKTDITASNGVIHVIDGVLLPSK